MSIGENNCTKSFQGPSTVSTSLQLGTRLVGWCPAGWGPGGGGWQPLQLCCVEQVEPCSPVSLRSAGLQRCLTQCNHYPAPVPQNSHLQLAQGALWQKSFCWHGFFPVWLLPELYLCGAPGESESPWQCLGISLIPDGSGLEPEAGGQSIQLPNWLNSVGKPALGSWKCPHAVSSQLVWVVLVVAPC